MATVTKKPSGTQSPRPATKAAAKRPVASKKRASPARAPVKPAVSETPATNVKKIEVVRSSFNMEASEYAHLAAFKKSLSTEKARVKKGQLLRAGIMLLRETPAAKLLSIIASLPPLKATASKRK